MDITPAAEWLGDALDRWVGDAIERGREDAKSAATWVADGNSEPDAIRQTLQGIEDGDPMTYDLLPPAPNLSGEWADSLTPLSLAREITGSEPPLWLIDELAEAYEVGVGEAWEDACVTELKKWI
jgi:hypothetical protein